MPPYAEQVMIHLQQRIAQLNVTVKASRQGLQNKLRSWLGGKKGAEGSAPLIGLHSGRCLSAAACVPRDCCRLLAMWFTCDCRNLVGSSRGILATPSRHRF